MPSLSTLNLAAAIRHRLVDAQVLSELPKIQRMLYQRRNKAVQTWMDTQSALYVELSIVDPQPWMDVLDPLYDAAENALHQAKSISDRNLQDWKKRNLGVRIAGITKGERTKIRRTIDHAISKGYGTNVVADLLRNHLLWGPPRAMRVARTEINTAMNATTYFDALGMTSYGYLIVKHWLATLDDRVREDHSEAHATQVNVPLTDPFIVGGSQLMFPGDTSMGAPAEQIVNCRCTLTIGMRR